MGKKKVLSVIVAIIAVVIVMAIFIMVVVKPITAPMEKVVLNEDDLGGWTAMPGNDTGWPADNVVWRGESQFRNSSVEVGNHLIIRMGSFASSFDAHSYYSMSIDRLMTNQTDLKLGEEGAYFIINNYVDGGDRLVAVQETFLFREGNIVVQVIFATEGYSLNESRAYHEPWMYQIVQTQIDKVHRNSVLRLELMSARVL